MAFDNRRLAKLVLKLEISMSQSLVKNLIHLVYSTKQRMKWIPESHQESLWAYQAGIFRTWESPALIIGGIEGRGRLRVTTHPLAMGGIEAWATTIQNRT